MMMLSCSGWVIYWLRVPVNSHLQGAGDFLCDVAPHTPTTLASKTQVNMDQASNVNDYKNNRISSAILNDSDEVPTSFSFSLINLFTSGTITLKVSSSELQKYTLQGWTCLRNIQKIQ